MSERTGQTWKLMNMDREGYVIFTVLRSEKRAISETEHEILVLETKDFSIFERDLGQSSFWWESMTLVWEQDDLYTRIV